MDTPRNPQGQMIADPQSGSDLAGSSAPQRAGQREALAVRIIAILRQFWVDETVPDEVQALELEGWLDVLDNLTQDELRAAWADYQRTGPRTQRGTLCRPDAGALYQRAMTARAHQRAAHARSLPPPPTVREKPREVLTDERRRQIMTEVFGTADHLDASAPVKRFGGEMEK